MPVTVQLRNITPQPWMGNKCTTREDFFDETSESNEFRTIITSSLTEDFLRHNHFSTSNNGFVWAVCEAHSGHHNLTIRPDDVWFAILTQLSFSMEGKKLPEQEPFHLSPNDDLAVEMQGIPMYIDVPTLKRQLDRLNVRKMNNNPGFIQWSMPDFSTTSLTDHVIASVLTAGKAPLSSCFGPKLLCGIPSVTLLGEVEDWEKLKRRLERIETMAEDAKIFRQALEPILANFVNSFTAPDDEEVIEIWNSIVTQVALGPDNHGFKGWISVFCFWDEHGRARFTENDINYNRVNGVVVETGRIPAGYCKVPININYNGREVPCMIKGGFVGIQGLANDEAEDISQQTGIRPASAWFVYLGKGPQTPCALQNPPDDGE